MSIIKKKKLMEMEKKELEEKLKEFRLELSKERAASEIGTSKNPGKITQTRREIARILTILNQSSKANKGEIKRGG